MSNHEDWAKSLSERGYEEVDTVGILSVGQRVRHSGEQYSEAYRDGTSVIDKIFVKKGNDKDVEVIIHRDKPRWGPTDTHSQWANYHTIPVNKFEFEK